jgi:hypothetical protein
MCYHVQHEGGIVNYSLDFLRGMHGAPAEAADEIERLTAEVERLRAIEAAARDLFNRGMDHVSQTYSRVAETRLRQALEATGTTYVEV